MDVNGPIIQKCGSFNFHVGQGPGLLIMNHGGTILVANDDDLGLTALIDQPRVIYCPLGLTFTKSLCFIATYHEVSIADGCKMS